VIVFGGDNNKCVAGPKGLAQYHHGWREVCLVDRWEIDLGNIDHFNVEMRDILACSTNQRPTLSPYRFSRLLAMMTTSFSRPGISSLHNRVEKTFCHSSSIYGIAIISLNLIKEMEHAGCPHARPDANVQSGSRYRQLSNGGHPSGPRPIAVSHSISNLEAELGITLFDRSSHRPTLTAQGQVLLEDCKALLLRADVLRYRARGMQNDLELSLTLMVDTLFPLSVISAALSRLHQEFPSVRIELEIGTLGGPLDALLAGTADVAITVGEDLRDARAEFYSLMPIRMVSVVAGRHPLGENRRQRPVTSTELADHVKVVLVDPSERTAGRDFGIISQRKWKVGTQEAKHALIRAGVGWGRLPDWPVNEDIQRGTLVSLSATALGNKGATESYAYLSRRIDRPLLSAGRFLKQALQE